MGRTPWWPITLLVVAASALSAGFAALRQIDQNRDEFEEMAALEQKKARLQEQLKDRKDIAGFGIKDGTLIVYLREAGAADGIPTEFEGVKVQTIVSGTFRAQRSAS